MFFIFVRLSVFRRVEYTLVSRQQLSLALDRWPVPVEDNLYDNANAHRQAFEQRCAKGVVCIELFVLEVVPDLYIQACQVRLADLCDGTALRLTPRNRYGSPEEAVQAAATKAMRLMKARRRQSGLLQVPIPPYYARKTGWKTSCINANILLDRQVKLFG